MNTKKRVDVFALSIYWLVIFLKVLGHIDDVVSDLFDRLDKRVTLVSVILTKTFISLSACRRAGEGRFIRFYTDVKTSTKSLYSGFGELLDTTLYLY
ncbi:hypothetical protein Gotri_020904 [Gossypium trilobum]|uniref:Uncharacterized protein n=1 Tax=Gossypium trilobum TaxID=34281 RepID=A0A7J9DB84_9ROSI|nr:hypothetical protein [Gossypium trilobum]